MTQIIPIPLNAKGRRKYMYKTIYAVDPIKGRVDLGTLDIGKIHGGNIVLPAPEIGIVERVFLLILFLIFGIAIIYSLLEVLSWIWGLVITMGGFYA